MAVKEPETLVLLTQENGIVVIPTATPLTRLNYFDGKFLRASDLKAEQEYLRQLVRQSNQAGGSGVVHGFELTLGGGDILNLGAGLAINPDGRVLLLPQDVSISVQELIEKSRELQKFFKEGHVISTKDFEECEIASETPPVNPAHPNDLYLIVICPAEALCGEADVYGKLCEEACATSSDRPYAIDGLIVRAIPLVLQTPLPHSKFLPIPTRKHLRSRVAAAYFEDERQKVASMISRFGLEQEIWCLGAEGANGACLPIGVIARAGATTIFLDAWIARRERMDTPPRRYWQWRMMMRPWDVFLAQILQFQCQLRDIFGGGLMPGGGDPCGDARTVIGEAARKIVDLIEAHREMTPQLASAESVGQMDIFTAKMLELEQMSQRLTATEQQMPVPMGDRLLIRGGIIELPSAGYLPVAPNVNASVNQQVRQMVGEGVDLRFCIVRPDYVAHALEEAQHMERISLIEGLEDPRKKPQVDILVPDAEIIDAAQPDTRLVFATALEVKLQIRLGDDDPPKFKTFQTVPFKGAARVETLASGGIAVYLSSTSPVMQDFSVTGGPRPKFLPPSIPELGLWLTLRSNHNLLLLQPGDKTSISALGMVGSHTPGFQTQGVRAEFNGELTIGKPEPGGIVAGTMAGSYSFEMPDAPVRNGNVELQFAAKQPAPDVIRIKISMASEGIEIVFETNWNNLSQVKARLSKTASIENRLGLDVPAFLSKDENIFSPSNPAHMRAVQGLQFVAAAFKQLAFVAEKTPLLFPETPVAQSGRVIRARHDWVLFHRRRRKDCDVAPVAVATRRYRVYQNIGSATFNVAASKQLTANDILNIPADAWTKLFNHIGDVTFGGGVATFVGDISSVKSGWQKVSFSAIVFGGIGSQGDAVSDGDSLALARLKALESELDQVSATARADVLPIVPPALSSPDIDGVIIIANGKGADTVDLKIGLIGHADLRIVKSAAPPTAGPGNNITYLLQLTNDGPSAAQSVTVTDPIPANTTFSSASILSGTDWTPVTPGVGSTGNVVFTKSAVAPGESASFQIVVEVSPNAQAETITNTATVGSTTPDLTESNNSSSAIVNVKQPVVVRALVITSTVDNDRHTVTPTDPFLMAQVSFVDNVPQGSALGKFLTDTSNAFLIRGITVADAKRKPDSDSQERLEVVVAALQKAGVTALNQQSTVALSSADRRSLTERSIELAGIDEVIFLEGEVHG